MPAVPGGGPGSGQSLLATPNGGGDSGGGDSGGGNSGGGDSGGGDSGGGDSGGGDSNVRTVSGSSNTGGTPPGATTAGGPPVYVDTNALATGIPQVTALAMRLGTVNASLSSTLAGLGEPWGGPNDPIGKTFAEAYLPARDDLLTGLSGTQNVLSSTADGITTMVRGYTNTEENNIIPNIKSGIGDTNHKA